MTTLYAVNLEFENEIAAAERALLWIVPSVRRRDFHAANLVFPFAGKNFRCAADCRRIIVVEVSVTHRHDIRFYSLRQFVAHARVRVGDDFHARRIFYTKTRMS